MITFYIQILFTLLIYLALEKDILVLKNQLQFKHFPTKFQRRKELIFSIFLPQVTAQLKKEMMNAGTLMVSYQPLGNIPNFFRYFK